MSSLQRILILVALGASAGLFLYSGPARPTTPGNAPQAAPEPVSFEIEVVEEEEVSEESSDSPFDAKNFTHVIGLGGGASGTYGGRFGGRGGWPRGGETYAVLHTPGFVETAQDPLLTFSADVDTGAYSNLRRMLLREARLPPADAIRIEELLNYFSYGDPEPSGEHPLAISVEFASCPWAPEHRLARVAVRSRRVSTSQRQPANLVFLIDVSGSMNSPRKLPLLKQAFGLLVNELQGRDTVTIVAYAGAVGVVLPPTACTQKDRIRSAIQELTPGGATAGAQGIQLAYELARQHFVPDGINRVLLATDGDFNVGISDRKELTAFIAEQARSGVFLTTLGFGTGNLNDATLEQLADHGNGHYAYVDSELEARKVLVEELGATLETVAKDVKLQLQFDPELVHSKRLVGYANRRLAHAQFDDDSQDAGELGAGHTVTALIEIVLEPAARGRTDAELFRVDVRYKRPAEDSSQLLSVQARDPGTLLSGASTSLRFAAAVAWFGQLLREPEEPMQAALVQVHTLAASSLGADVGQYRAGFLELLEAAQALASGG